VAPSAVLADRLASDVDGRVGWDVILRKPSGKTGAVAPIPAQVSARLLCTVAPAGLEVLAEFGDPVPTRTSPAPLLSDAEREERLRRAMAAAGYGMEILPPPAR
jgi:hypothetical protein